LKYGAQNGMHKDALLLYLTLLPPKKIAVITVLELMRMCGSGGISEGMKALRGMLAVGKAVETEYKAETIKNVAGVDSPEWLRTIDPQNQRPTRHLVGQVWRNLGRDISGDETNPFPSREGSSEQWKSVWTPSWSQNIHLGLGSYLTKALLDVAMVERTARDPETGETM
jgi:DNA-directed RNA polymerase